MRDSNSESPLKYRNVIHPLNYQAAGHFKLASFKADQRPYRRSAANHVGAAVLAHMARRLDAAHRWYFGNP